MRETEEKFYKDSVIANLNDIQTIVRHINTLYELIECLQEEVRILKNEE